MKKFVIENISADIPASADVQKNICNPFSDWKEHILKKDQRLIFSVNIHLRNIASLTICKQTKQPKYEAI